MEWYTIDNVQQIDSPALVVYADRAAANIRLLTGRMDDVARLRPHVKTNKIKEVCSLMLDAGITRFKCATIAEAEMLAMIQAPDVLLAYQPVGPKIDRLLTLIRQYPATRFSCLVDDPKVAAAISEAVQAFSKTPAVHAGLRGPLVLDIWIDLNVGQNRTGIVPREEAVQLWKHVRALPGIRPVGLHAYDGHIHEVDLAIRKQHCDKAFEPVEALAKTIEHQFGQKPLVVAGGSPTFPIHLDRPGIQCSPGTFVFWDYSYKHGLPDEPFEYAALVLTRVISIIDGQTICTDLGHKSVAAENPQPRVHFLNAPAAVPFSQSEEHLVLKVDNAAKFAIGDVLYGVPMHICPTVALYEKAMVVKEHQVTDQWKVIARDRKINI